MYWYVATFAFSDGRPDEVRRFAADSIAGAYKLAFKYKGEMRWRCAIAIT